MPPPLQALASLSRTAGLGAPLAVLAEAHRPLFFVYAQLAHMAAPHLAPYAGGMAGDLADWLEDPRALEDWLRALTDADHDPPVRR